MKLGPPRYRTDRSDGKPRLAGSQAFCLPVQAPHYEHPKPQHPPCLKPLHPPTTPARMRMIILHGFRIIRRQKKIWKFKSERLAW